MPCGSMDQTLKDTGFHIHPQKEEPYLDWAIESYGTDGTAVDGLTPETLPSDGQHTTSVNEAQTTVSNEGQRIAASEGQKTAIGEAQRTTKFQEGDTGQPDPSDKNTRHSTSGNDSQRQGAADAGGTSETHVQKPGMAYEVRPASPIQDDESTPESHSFLSGVGKCFGDCLHCFNRPLEPATIRNEQGGQGGIRMETLFPNNPQPNNPRPEKQKKQWPSSWTSKTWGDCLQRCCPCCCCLFCLCRNDSEAGVGPD
ncbi:hypothetical protein D6D01_05921 [Aureobasidium pullulans]|uniref:Uncharacterized protein n=1 Tax=Aureobasidium pullulans TaxID=5580 RepID=A0A4S9L573_AURPU|nr:hypothetical protein D6D01_05921 [Aureobasidium pullulans]